MCPLCMWHDIFQVSLNKLMNSNEQHVMYWIQINYFQQTIVFSCETDIFSIMHYLCINLLMKNLSDYNMCIID